MWARRMQAPRFTRGFLHFDMLFHRGDGATRIRGPLVRYEQGDTRPNVQVVCDAPTGSREYPQRVGKQRTLWLAATRQPQRETA
jgi:hypothetical protein